MVIVGENRTFDHLFATYQPAAGESVNNLASEGIVQLDGTRGTNYSEMSLNSASDTTTYEIQSIAEDIVLQPSRAYQRQTHQYTCATNGMCNYGNARSSEDGLSSFPVDYYQFLLTGGSGLTGSVPDSRISGVSSSAPYTTLLPGPVQLTNSTTFSYFSYLSCSMLFPDVAADRLRSQPRPRNKSERLSFRSVCVDTK